MTSCKTCGATESFNQTEVVATTPSVRNWFAYVKYRQKDSVSSGSLVISVRMKTRGFEGKFWRDSCPKVGKLILVFLVGVAGWRLGALGLRLFYFTKYVTWVYRGRGMF